MGSLRGIIYSNVGI